MMGKHQPAPKLYYELSLDCLVPQDYLLRQIFAELPVFLLQEPVVGAQMICASYLVVLLPPLFNQYCHCGMQT